MSWETISGGIRLVGNSSTRQAAMNRVDRPWRPGLAEVVNRATREKWRRRGGTWVQLVPALKRKGRAA